MPEVFFKISAKTPGAILQPQPPPCDKELKRGSVAGVNSLFAWILWVLIIFISLIVE